MPATTSFRRCNLPFLIRAIFAPLQARSTALRATEALPPVRADLLPLVVANLLTTQGVPPSHRHPQLLVPPADEEPVLLHEPDLGLPAPRIPRHAGVHAEAVAVGAPADEAEAEVLAELLLVEGFRVVLECLEGLVAEALEREDVLLYRWLVFFTRDLK